MKELNVSLCQKQPPEMSNKKTVLINLAKFIRKHLCQIFFFSKVQKQPPEVFYKKKCT